MSAHTPGPWLFTGRVGHGLAIKAVADGGGPIAIAYGSPSQPHGEANAHLIAAAPELLLALEEVAGVLAAINCWDCDNLAGQEEHDDCPECASWRAAVQLARAALAKAKP